MPHRDPLAIFFKLPPDASPVAVLGLRAGRVSDEDILEARTRRLHAVDQHALAGTPDADEARLAVHTAAARLLQQAAIHRSRPPAADSPGGPLPRPRPRFGLPKAAAALDRETLLLVGLAGGWSPRVLTRLAAIAISRGLSTRDAVAAAMRLATKPTGSSGSVLTATASPAPTPPRRRADHTEQPAARQMVTAEPMSDEDLLENWVKTTLVLVGSVGVTLAILILGAVWALGTLSSSKVKTPDEKPDLAATTPAPSDRVAPPRDEVDNADLVMYELNAARSLTQARRSIQAVARVEAAMTHWLARWPSHPPGAWREVLGSLTPLIDQIRDAPGGDRALADMFRRLAPDPTKPLDAADVPRQVALGAINASLSSPAESSELSATLRDIWRSRTPYAVTAGALPAAKDTLRDLTRGQLAPTPEAYDAWTRSAQAVSKILAENPEGLLLAGASDLLGRLDPPTPGERDAIKAMTVQLDWRSGSTARTWLLDRLNDRTVHPERIAAAINTLAKGTSAPGVPTSLQLDPAANWEQRYEVSKTLGSAWGLRVSINRDLFIRDWLQRADELLGSPTPATQRQTLQRLGDLAYLNTAATLSLLGQPESAISNLSRSSARITRPEPLSPLFRENTQSPLTLAAAGNQNDALLNLLGVIKNQSGSLSHADAATLVELAFRERNEAVRTAAADALRSTAASPEIILAAIESAPLIADTAENRGLLSLLAGDAVVPAPGQEWGDAVHSALARALLSRTTSSAAVLDDESARIRSAYAASSVVARVDREAPLTDHVRALTDAQLARVNPDLGVDPVATPSRIVSLRDTRLRVATSSVQRFAIELQALAAATALAASSNNESLERPARSLWDRLIAERALARSALDQALATERMLSDLNAVLLTARPPSSRSTLRPRRLATDTDSPPVSEATTEPIAAPWPTDSDLAARLERLTTDTPGAYLDVADELLVDGRESLAVHTLVAAVFLAADRGDNPTAASACLALATLTPDTGQREILRALADTLNPRLSRPAWLDPSHAREGLDPASLRAAGVLLDLRRGHGDRAADALRDQATRDRLADQPELSAVAAARGTSTLPMLARLAREWPCPECGNERTVRPRGQTQVSLCPHCHGHPGPELTDQEQIAWLTAEVRLLSPREPWSSALLMPGHNAPVAEPDLSLVPTFFRVNPSLSLYRNGQWVRP